MKRFEAYKKKSQFLSLIPLCTFSGALISRLYSEDMFKCWKSFLLTMGHSSTEKLQSIFFPLIILLTAQTTLTTSGSNNQSSSSIPQPYPNILNPDSLAYDYSGQAYYEYASAYQDNNLRMTADISYYDQDDDYGNADSHSDNDTEQAKSKVKKMEESYSEMASRLNCDKPWFWLAIKCTWLDVKGNTVMERTRRNAITSAWLIGTLLIILLTCLCGSYCVYCLKFRKRSELIKLRKRSAPGRMELPSGKVVRFQPTEEEEKAFEELVKAILIQEMI